LESDGSDLDNDETAMITRKFKKFFKKAGGNFKKGSTNKPRNSDRDQFWVALDVRHDHVVKNYPM